MSAVNNAPPLGIGSRAVALALIATMTTAASLLAAPGAHGLCGALLGLIVVAIADIDARQRIIPDGLNAAALAVGLVNATAVQAGPEVLLEAGQALSRAVFTAGVFWLVRYVYKRARGRDGLGLGDVKLAAVAGLWLDWTAIAIAVEIAALAAIAFYLGRSLLRRDAMSGVSELPFGLFLAPAIWLGWLGQTLFGDLSLSMT